MKPFNDCCSPMEQDLIIRQKMLAMLRENDDFKKCITHIVENYIKMIDTKISNQDLKIDQAISYMKDNIQKTVTDIIIQLVEEEKIQFDVKYDEETESLIIGGVVIE